MATYRFPRQRWEIAPENTARINSLVQTTGLSPLVAQVLLNRQLNTPEAAAIHLDPELQVLPSALAEFTDLAISVDLLKEAIASEEKIAICGDYDADGMTSTALLLRTLRHLGADVDCAIPSRMKDGYGINKRIVKEFAESGVAIIITVDNGISAYEPINLARDLGLDVIITDHHDLPEKLPPANAILNPKLLRETSPYYGLAGVGVAYLLALTLALELESLDGLGNQLLELFTLGTIADLAPLVGVNRRWLRKGLLQLPKSELAGVQALMQVGGVNDEQKKLNPDDIGFRLGPRINAIGRIGDPQVVIELLTTDDPGVALEKAMICEQINAKRQQLCEEIETQAIALIEGKQEIICPLLLPSFLAWPEARVLVILDPSWHHGVIGIVASRLVERYGVPVFICTLEEDGKIRGSARGIKEFHVFQALDYCGDVLGKYGGHKAAGGFSLEAENLGVFHQKLSEFAQQCLKPEHLQPLVEIDGEAKFSQLTPQLYQEIDSLYPWGIGNAEPIFWTANVRILEQQNIGKGHLKFTLAQDLEGNTNTIKAIAWRWADYLPLPSCLDIAYKLKENRWNEQVNIELEIIGVRLPHSTPINDNTVKKAAFTYKGRSYACSLWESLNELRIRNDQGKVLAIKRGERSGLLGTSRENAKEVNVTQSPYYELIKAAVAALNQ